MLRAPRREASAQRPPSGPARARAGGAAAAWLAALAALALLPGAAAQDDYDLLQPGAWRVGFVHAGNPEPEATFAEIMGSGACVFDYDGDGWEDLLLVNGRYANASKQASLDPRSALYRNLEGQGFELVEGALNVSAWGMGCSTGDYDDDGDPDVALSTWGSPLLFRNDGNATFTNVTTEAGLWHPECLGASCFGASLAWLDYDKDGDLDLYVLNYLAWDGEGPAAPLLYDGQCNLLFRNEGDGSFTEVGEQAGAADCGRNHLALAVADVDGDGWQDIFVASDETADTFLRNKGNGTFEDLTESAGLGDPRGGMGAAWGDYDGDGLLDLVITHFESETFALYRQGRNLTFEDRADLDGLGITQRFVGWGSEFLDYDDDGDLDLLLVDGHVNVSYAQVIPYGQQNLLLRNQGGAFANVTGEAWHPEPVLNVSRGLAVGDLDQDGYPDLVVVNNPNETAELWSSARGPNNWLTLRLAGNATVNAQALGAVAEAQVGGATLGREVTAAGGYLSQSSRDLHVGLGHATRVDLLRVAWPDGTAQEFRDVAANRVLRLRAGGALEELRAHALAAAEVTIHANRLDPVSLTADALRAPGGVAAQRWTVEGETVEGAVANRSFPELGTYDAVFRLEAADGTWDEAVTRVVVDNLPPAAVVEAPAAADRVMAVALGGGASSDRDGRVTNWTWTVEGVAYHGPEAQHTFAALGPQKVRLLVRDNEGSTAEAAVTIEVVNLGPVARAGPDVVGNVLSTFAFDGADSSDPDGGIVAWAWDLGDGSSAQGRRVEKGYAAQGSYVVALTVTDSDGATARDDLVVTVNAENAPPVPLPGLDREGSRVQPVAFDGSRSYDPDGRVVAWRWAFGDGSAAEGAVVDHTYAALGEYLATLTVTDDTGGSASAPVLVRIVNLAPRVDAGPPLQQEGLAPVSFTASGEDPDGSIASWTWDFGDGSTDQGAEVAHRFARYGHHQARLTATDNEGLSANATRRVWLYARPVPVPGPDRVTDRLTTLAFDGRGSFDPDGRVVAWSWDFGDGDRAGGPAAQHRFRSLGAFNVTLTVADDDGFTNSSAARVEVVNLPPVPRVEAWDLANLNQSLPYDGAGSLDPDGAVVAWHWDFGDGAVAQGAVAEHAYEATGTWSVVLNVTDNDGGAAEAAWAVEVVDWLRVRVATERASYGPLDRPRGVVEVRFANGLPARDAEVDLDIAYRVTGPPDTAVPPLSLHLQRARGLTDAAGLLRFDAPPPWPAPLDAWLPYAQAPNPGVPGPGGGPWGDYRVVADAAWKGNGGAGGTHYRVHAVDASAVQRGAGSAGPGSAENLQGGAGAWAAAPAVPRGGPGVAAAPPAVVQRFARFQEAWA